MTQKQCSFKIGQLIKIWPANKIEPILGLVVEIFNIGNTISYKILSDTIYHRSENNVSHIDYDIDKELDSLFPMTRRIFPSLIANDLISVQPLIQSKGHIFSL